MLVGVADDSKALPIGPACTNVHNILSPVLVHVDVRLKWRPLYLGKYGIRIILWWWWWSSILPLGAQLNEIH